MQNNFSFLIAMAGWEDRFHEGMVNNLKFLNDDASILIFHTEKYQLRTRKNREVVIQTAREKDYRIIEFCINGEGDPESYFKLKNSIENLNISEHSNVLVDISTMNRENIWYVLFILNQIGANINYVYYPSLRHGADKLTADPSKPRFLFKMSGEPKLGKETAIIILTGFDSERTTHFVSHFDPSKVLLGVQTGEQLDNHIRNIRKHDKSLITDCSVFEINSYDFPTCTVELIEKAATLYDDYNLIVTSLGPKIGSVSCFEMWTRMSSTALAYIPVNEVSETYSQGTNIKGMIGPSLLQCPKKENSNTMTKVDFMHHTTQQALNKSIHEFALPLPDHIKTSENDHRLSLYYDTINWDTEIKRKLSHLKLSN